MRDDRMNEQFNRGETAAGRDEVITSGELRDGNATPGRVSQADGAYQAPAVRRDTVVERGVSQAPGYRDDVAIPEAYNLPQDRVRWGPIMAGLATALTTLLLLSVLGLAVGLTAIDAERAAIEGGIPFQTGLATAIWGALSALIAFGLGGWVAGRTAAVFDRGWGALNGALVFLVAVPLILFLATSGIGGILGTLGNYASSLNLDPQSAAQQANAQEVGQAAENARNGAWGTVLGLLLGLGASAFGGVAGTRRLLHLDAPDGRRRINE